MNANVQGDSNQYPELLTDLAELVGESLRRNGVAGSVAATVGFEAAEYIREQWSGHSLYFPKGQAFDLSRRDIQIFEAHDGTNISALADEYNLTEVRIYQIVKRVLMAQRKFRQPDLFEVLQP